MGVWCRKGGQEKQAREETNKQMIESSHNVVLAQTQVDRWVKANKRYIWCLARFLFLVFLAAIVRRFCGE